MMLSQQSSIIAADYLNRCHACDVNQSSASRVIRRQNSGLHMLRSGNLGSFSLHTIGLMVFPQLCFSDGRKGRGVYRRRNLWCSRIHLGNRLCMRITLCESPLPSPHHNFVFFVSFIVSISKHSIMGPLCPNLNRTQQ